MFTIGRQDRRSPRNAKRGGEAGKCPSEPVPPCLLDRHSRLLRWAELLDRDPHRLLRLLPPAWTGSAASRRLLDVRGSAIEVVAADPIFRIDGLTDPTLPGAQKFFGLSNAELDRIVAGSGKLPFRPAWQIAARARNVADPRAGNLLAAIGMVLAVLLGALMMVIARW